MNPNEFKPIYTKKAFHDIENEECYEQNLISLEIVFRINELWKDNAVHVLREAVKSYYELEDDYFTVEWEFTEEVDGVEVPALDEDAYVLVLKINWDEKLPAIDAWSFWPDEYRDYHTYDEFNGKHDEFADLNQFIEWFKEGLPEDWVIDEDSVDGELLTSDDWFEHCEMLEIAAHEGLDEDYYRDAWLEDKYGN